MIALREGHESVLLDEAVTALVTNADGRYIDGTFGRGGHSLAILERLSAAGSLLAIDRDPAAVAAASLIDDPRFAIASGNFSQLAKFAARRQWQGRVDGVLLDLGVSSPQLDDGERDFSFVHDGPLDMRMNPAEGISAAQWLATAAAGEIADVLRDYGEERFAWRMAKAVVAARAEMPIERTSQLADIIRAANPAWEQGKHPATRAFQAIRIFVNSEMEELKRALTEALDCLCIGGRLVVISFHSLEDRIVKRFFRQHARGRQLPRSVPVTEDAMQRRLSLPGRAVRPSPEEVVANPRARSAILRVAEKIGE